MNKIFTLFLLLLFCFQSLLFSCTTLVIGKKATIDGSVIVAHSDDDNFGDQRICFVPKMEFKEGDKRALYSINPGSFPRFVGSDRGEDYDIKNYPKSKPTGYIDQVKKTYSYIDANYGILNEHQLAIGECTDSSNFYFENHSKDRLLDISTISQICLERCKRAKNAVILAGKLAEEYGYYGWGETLIFADTEEAWVFEISATPEGKSAIWVAKRVPDDEIFVAANQFRIQDIEKDKKDVLFSTNLFDIALNLKIIKKGDNKLNWLKLVCPGEFDHPYYSLRRVWRIFSRVAPSKKFSPWVKDAFTKYYPFSVKPDKKLDVKDIFSLYRDHYENTEFSLRKGLASGAFGSPARFLGKYDRCDFSNKRKKPLEGAWERPISEYYTGYSYVTKLRGFLPDDIGGISWIGFDEPYSCCYMPVYAGSLKLPKSFHSGSPRKFDRNFAWWAFNFNANWCRNNYDLAIKDVQKKQKELEENAFEDVLKIEKKALDFYKINANKCQEVLTQYSSENAKNVLNSWWLLANFLMEKYNDGYVNKPKMAEEIGYPKWYRDDVGYQMGPISYEKTKKNFKFFQWIKKIFDKQE